MQTWFYFFQTVTIINVIILIGSSFLLFVFNEPIYDIYHKLFKVDRKTYNLVTFGYLAILKVVTITLCFSPWLALAILLKY